MEKCVVFCMHGNEQASLAALDLAKHHQLKTIIANPEAVKRNIRFIDADLNRIFPGREDGNHEERIAHRLSAELRKFDLVLDLHTATRDTPPFIITTKTTPEHLALASSLGVKNLIIMSPGMANGKSLIDNCKCGVSVELGRHGTKEAKSMAKTMVENFANQNLREELNLFRVTKIIRKPNGNFSDSLKNFEIVKARSTFAKSDKEELVAETDFYPILAGEGNYTDVLCLACETMDLETFNKLKK